MTRSNYGVYRVYGRNGHRQAESFAPSKAFMMDDGSAYVGIINADKTGTNDYTVVSICTSGNIDPLDILRGQIYDGIFENCRCGKIVDLIMYEEVQL